MRMVWLAAAAVIPRDSIVGIFDLDTASVSRYTRDFLRRAQENGQIEAIGDDLPQSFVATKEKIYLSPQSSAGLAHRVTAYQGTRTAHQSVPKR